jgi:anthranilate phosphoribosyltransferase
LGGTRGPRRDIACLNAAAGIVAGGKAATLAEGYTIAGTSIDSGQALKALQGLIERTQRG